MTGSCESRAQGSRGSLAFDGNTRAKDLGNLGLFDVGILFFQVVAEEACIGAIANAISPRLDFSRILRGEGEGRQKDQCRSDSDDASPIGEAGGKQNDHPRSTQVSDDGAPLPGLEYSRFHCIWVLPKLGSLFWVPIIIRHLLFRVPKKGP